MKIIVAMPIKASADPLLLAGMDYLKKSRSPLQAEALLVPPKISLGEDQKLERMVHEGRLLLKKTEGYVRIALTESGTPMSSLKFCGMLEKSMHTTSKMAFIIGGAFGLSDEVVKSCQKTLSLSAMTMPHRMAFLVLAEQIFRASEIMNNTAYHKE